MEQFFTYSISFFSMGSNHSSDNSVCNLIASTSTCVNSQKGLSRSNALAPIFIEALLNKLTLADFQNALTMPECFYVLSTLIQQYYLTFKRQTRAFISANLCCVNELGEVKVHTNLENADAANFVSTANFVSILSQVLELVQFLAKEKDWGSNGQCGYFYQRMLKTIYRFHNNDELLFKELMDEVFSYMEYNQYRTNLLSAIIRRAQPLQEPFLQRTKFHKRYESASFESFAKRDRPKTMELSSLMKKQAPISLYSRQKDRQSTVYHRKMVRTEGEDYFQNIFNSGNEQKYEQQTLQNYSTTRPNNRNYISSQYSMNINSYPQKNSPTKSKVKFKKIAQKVHYENDNQNDNQDSRNKALRRNNTMNQFFCPQESKLSNTKSVLQNLARSVIVRDEPGSKSFIF